MTYKNLQKTAIIFSEENDVKLSGFDAADQETTITVRAGSYYDINSVTLYDDNVADILFATGELFPQINLITSGIRYIGKPNIVDKRSPEKQRGWEEPEKKEEKKEKEFKPKTIKLKKDKGQHQGDDSWSFFKKK